MSFFDGEPGPMRPRCDLAAPLSVAFGCDPPACWGRAMQGHPHCFLELRERHGLPGRPEIAALAWLVRRHAGSRVGIFCSHPIDDDDPASVWERLDARGALPPCALGDGARRFRGCLPNGDFLDPRSAPSYTAPSSFGDVVSYASDAAGMAAAEALAAGRCAAASLRPAGFDWYCGERGGWPGGGEVGHGFLPVLRARAGFGEARDPFPDAAGLGRRFAECYRTGAHPRRGDDRMVDLIDLGYALLDADPATGVVSLWRPTLFEVTWPHAKLRRPRGVKPPIAAVPRRERRRERAKRRRGARRVVVVLDEREGEAE